MMALRHSPQLDGIGADDVSASHIAPLRRMAFTIRRQGGMSRAVMLSILVHASLGAVLVCQLVPRQFIRMGGASAPKTLEVFLLAGPPAGGAGPAAAVPPAQAPAPVQPVALPAPEPVVAVVAKPKPAVQEKKKPAASRPAAQEATPAQGEQKSDSTAAASNGPAQSGNGSGAGSSAGQQGSGSGNGGLYETSFGQADGPRFLEYAAPQYPLAARQQGRQGTVMLRLTIDEKGNLVQVEVLSSPSEGFAESAVAAIRRSRFAPARSSGRPVAARAVLPVRFALRQ